MKPYPTRRQKTQRAYRAYVDLMDTAKWIENELRGPLWTHDLTLLELLYRDGALTLSDVIRKRQVKRQNIMVVVKRLRRRGWVERVDVTLPPVPGSLKKVGRWASVVGLTKPGKRFIGNILPSHSKLVTARYVTREQQENVRFKPLFAQVRRRVLCETARLSRGECSRRARFFHADCEGKHPVLPVAPSLALAVNGADRGVGAAVEGGPEGEGRARKKRPAGVRYGRQPQHQRSADLSIGTAKGKTRPPLTLFAARTRT